MNLFFLKIRRSRPPVFPLAAPSVTVNSPAAGMKFSIIKSPAFQAAWLVCLLTAVLPGPLCGQISALKSLTGDSSAEQAKPAETPEESKARLERWLQESRDMLAALDTGAITVTLPKGIVQADVEDRRRLLEQLVLILNQSLKSDSSHEDAEKDLKQARAEDEGWIGFKEQPPFSVLMIDDLLNERDAAKAKLSTARQSLANYQHLLANMLVATKAAEELVNQNIIGIQRAAEDALDAAKWKLENARANARLLAARTALFQNQIEVSKLHVSAAESELSLLDRQLKIAKSQPRFNEEDTATIKRLSGERKDAIRKQIDATSKKLRSAIVARDRAQAEFDKAAAATPENPDPDALDLARLRTKTATERVEALQSVSEVLEALIQLENLGVDAYRDRRAALDAPTPAERQKYVDSLATFVERLLSWKAVLEHEVNDTSADLGKLESRAASITSDDPRFSLINEQRTSLSEQLSTLRRALQAVIAQRTMIKRWVADFSPKEDENGFFHRVKAMAGAASDVGKKIWSFEVHSFEDKIEVDGQTIVGKIPVTLGMLLRALLFFVIGYLVASKIATRVQSKLVRKGHIGDAQARTLRNWLMIVVGVFLAIGTLAFLKIPLTVFAFFGGALAIGLGFGMQTLIKNFISGIIVLIEHKVRVGDVLDVDGIIGTVAEINTRSSVIRGADDVETMIPNSVFLENRVTNWTLSTSKIRSFVRIGVSYGTPPQKIMEILTESAGRHGLVCKDPAPFAVFEDFGDSALIFCLYFWLKLDGVTNRIIVQSDLRLMIEKRLAELGVVVPFPQRDVNLTASAPIKVEWSPQAPTPEEPAKEPSE